MTNNIFPSKRIEVLVNTLASERYIRRSLLAELVEELTRANDCPEAVRAGRALLSSMDDGIDELEYEQRLERLVELTRAWYLESRAAPESPAVDHPR